MRRTLFPVFLTLLLVAAGSYAQQSPFDGKTWWGHVGVLAADKMQGRDTGTAGLRQAESYVVDQLKMIGLQPAGERGFYQQVQLESRRLNENESSLALVKNGEPQPLVLGEDAVFNTR